MGDYDEFLHLYGKRRGFMCPQCGKTHTFLHISDEEAKELEAKEKKLFDKSFPDLPPNVKVFSDLDDFRKAVEELAKGNK